MLFAGRAVKLLAQPGGIVAQQFSPTARPTDLDFYKPFRADSLTKLHMVSVRILLPRLSSRGNGEDNACYLAVYGSDEVVGVKPTISGGLGDAGGILDKGALETAVADDEGGCSAGPQHPRSLRNHPVKVFSIAINH